MAACPGNQVHHIIGIARGILDGLCSNGLGILAFDSSLPEQCFQHSSSLLGRDPLMDHLAVAIHDIAQRLIGRLDRLPEPLPDVVSFSPTAGEVRKHRLTGGSVGADQPEYITLNRR